jgi:hypothetical protein
MASKKQQQEATVYRVTEIIGTSPVSWEEAARSAVETACCFPRFLVTPLPDSIAMT